MKRTERERERKERHENVSGKESRDVVLNLTPSSRTYAFFFFFSSLRFLRFLAPAKRDRMQVVATFLSSSSRLSLMRSSERQITDASHWYYGLALVVGLRTPRKHFALRLSSGKPDSNLSPFHTHNTKRKELQVYGSQDAVFHPLFSFDLFSFWNLYSPSVRLMEWCWRGARIGHTSWLSSILSLLLLFVRE